MSICVYVNLHLFYTPTYAFYIYSYLYSSVSIPVYFHRYLYLSLSLYIYIFYIYIDIILLSIIYLYQSPFYLYPSPFFHILSNRWGDLEGEPQQRCLNSTVVWAHQVLSTAKGRLGNHGKPWEMGNLMVMKIRIAKTDCVVRCYWYCYVKFSPKSFWSIFWGGKPLVMKSFPNFRNRRFFRAMLGRWASPGFASLSFKELDDLRLPTPRS